MFSKKSMFDNPRLTRLKSLTKNALTKLYKSTDTITRRLYFFLTHSQLHQTSTVVGQNGPYYDALKPVLLHQRGGYGDHRYMVNHPQHQETPKKTPPNPTRSFAGRGLIREWGLKDQEICGNGVKCSHKRRPRLMFSTLQLHLGRFSPSSL